MDNKIDLDKMEMLKADYKKRQEIKNEKLKPLKDIFRKCDYCEFVKRNRYYYKDSCLIKNRSISAFEALFCRYYKIR